MTNVQLASNYQDYYDRWMHTSYKRHEKRDYVFNRNPSIKQMDREQTMLWLNRHGVGTVPYGIPAVIHSHLERLNRIPSPQPIVEPDSVQVVVHTNPKAHGGKGKKLVPILQAMRDYMFDFAIMYPYKETRIPSKSLKLVSVGIDCYFIVEYKSLDDWRSNVGAPEITVHESYLTMNTVLERLRLLTLPMYDPIYTMDLVDIGGTSDGKAVFGVIDYNTTPVLENSKIHHDISGEEVAERVIKWFEKFGDRYESTQKTRGKFQWTSNQAQYRLRLL